VGNFGSLACIRLHHFFFFEGILCKGSSSEGTIVATAAPSGAFNAFIFFKILFDESFEVGDGGGWCS
jgi:hypothetical protein